MSLVTRRTVLAASAWLLSKRLPLAAQASGVHFSVAEFDQARILAAARREVAAPDLTLTAVKAPDSKDPHRFFCDASLLNADASATGFLGHSNLLQQVTARVAALTAAWRLDRSPEFLRRALQQLNAWCLDPKTAMLPTLEPETPADAAGDPDLRRNCLRFTSTLPELARASSFLYAAPECPPEQGVAMRAWFAELLQWYTGSARAVVARDSTRADSIFWTAQASELARFTRNDPVLRDCTHRFRDKLLRQLSLDGYLPYALQSRRPYAESMYLLECLASICESISTPFESAWPFTLPDGRGMRAAISWAAPYLRSRGKWPQLADVRHFSEQPLRENALLFAGRAFNQPEYVELWKTLPPDTEGMELRREHPITQPALWAVRPPA